MHIDEERAIRKHQKCRIQGNQFILKCILNTCFRFQVIHLTGHIVFKEDGYRQLLAIGRPLAHPSNIEVPLGSSTFLTKHTLDMKFSYVDSPK